MSNLRSLEWGIIKDKLSQGVNGIEWLVLNYEPTKHRLDSLSDWFESLEAFGHRNADQVMLDALQMDDEAFYEIYEFNWWMSVSYTLTHLCLLRERSYDKYFVFLQRIKGAKSLNGYEMLLKLGRKLGSHSGASEYARSNPESVLSTVATAEKALLWTKIGDFFSLFPPIKRYDDDGSWDYKSTLQMIKKDFGTSFGKDDLKMLLMSKCYENKFIHLVGFAYMLAVSEVMKRATGEGALARFMREERDQT